MDKNAENMTDAEIDTVLERFDQTDPALQRRIIAQFVINSLLSEQKLLVMQDAYFKVMDTLKRSRMQHGDCKSSRRYGGAKPRACTACMANLAIDEMIDAYKGRVVKLA